MINKRFNINEYKNKINKMEKIYSGKSLYKQKPFINENKSKNNYTNQYNLEFKRKSKKKELHVNTKARKRLNYNFDKNNNYKRSHIYDDYKYNNFYKTEYIYYPVDDLPYMGWIQLCIFCYNQTTSIENIDKYKLFCCNKCQKKYKIDDKKNKIKVIKKFIR